MVRMQREDRGRQFVGCDFDRYTLLNHRNRDHHPKRRLTLDDDSLDPCKWSGRDSNACSHGEGVRLGMPQMQTTAKNLDLMIADAFVNRTSAHDPNHTRSSQNSNSHPRRSSYKKICWEQWQMYSRGPVIAPFPLRCVEWQIAIERLIG